MSKKLFDAYKWDILIKYLTNIFSPEEKITISGILFLIGIQELGQGPKKFNKDEKINIIHIAICRVLEPFNFYIFKGIDNEGWPHYKLKEKIPKLKSGEQTILIKKAIIQYFDDENILKNIYN